MPLSHSAVSTLRALGLATSSATRVALRRVARGPLRPDLLFTVEALAQFLRTDGARLDALPVAEARASRDALTVRSRALRRVRHELVDAGGVRATWLSPRGASASNRAALLYFHGGGYVVGSPLSHADSIARLALAMNAPALAVDYRLAPEHPFPAAVDDALASYRFLLARGVDAKRIVVAGDSAGGGLAAALLVAARDAGLPLPAGAVLFSPWVDLQRAVARASAGSMVAHEPFDFIRHAQLTSWAGAYLGDTDPAHPLASPLHADLRGLPPLLVQIGDAEILLDEGTLFAERALSAGVPTTLEIVPGMFHSFQFFGGYFAAARRAFDAAARFAASVTE